MHREIYRSYWDSRPSSLEREYSVQLKATQSRPISGQTWSMEPWYKELILISKKTCWENVTPFGVLQATSTTAYRPVLLLLLQVIKF